MNERSRDDRGGATIFVVIAVAAVLIGAGFSIDVGQYVAAARSAQNSSDATALAVATDCVNHGGPVGDYRDYRKDEQEISTPTCVGGKATITTTKPVGGLLLKSTAGDVKRSATARWGSLKTAKTIPLTIANCEFTQYPTGEASDVIIHLPDPTGTGAGCPGDAGASGGFGQLRDLSPQDGEPCLVVITAESTAQGKPGNDLQNATDCLEPLPGEFLIPVFDETVCPSGGCQGNGEFFILGFAKFKLTGFNFTSDQGPNRGRGSLQDTPCPDSPNCIRGDFIEFIESAGAPCDPDVDECNDFGVNLIYLSD